MDEDEIAFKEKQKAGMWFSSFILTCRTVPDLFFMTADAKANKEMAEKAKGKGPLNAGQQGIKKSGKK